MAALISDGFTYEYDYAPGTITITQAAQPNLTQVASNSLLVINGTTVDIQITVVNDGGATAGSSHVGYYLSEDANLSLVDDYLIGDDNVTSLSPQATSDESLNIDVTSVTPAIPPGTYYVMYYIDHLDEVLESNENDNLFYFPGLQVTILAPIDCLPDIEDIRIDGSDVVFGTSINVELTDLNQTFEIKLDGENDGTEAAPLDISNLTIAFPQYTSDNDKNLITINSNTSSDLIADKYYGSEALGGDQYADYIVVEGADNDGWQPGESNSLYLDVQPKQWGDFYIEFRMGLPTDNSWNNFIHDPSGGYCPTCSENDPDIDPIKFHCYYIKVKVIQSGTQDIDVEPMSLTFQEQELTTDNATILEKSALLITS